MIRTTYKRRRLTVAIALVAALAAWSAPSAVAFDARSPDTRDVGQQAMSLFTSDARSPDTRDAAEQAKPSIVVDGRSPDSRDAAQRHLAAIAEAWMGALLPRSQPEAPAPGPGLVDRFHWGDFGIGVGVSAGFMLLVAGLAASALVARHRRGARTGPAIT
jgi:hypothetical protein